MKRVIFLLVILFSGVFVLAGSSTQANIIIPGCSFNYEGDIVTVSAGSCSGGDVFGLFYCSEDYTAYSTTQDVYGCSRGGTDTSDPCCPLGTFCNSTSYLCERRIDSCASFSDENNCEEVGCFWMDSVCVESKSDFGCDHYDNQTACEGDFWNLGVEGIGTDYCGDGFECGGMQFLVSTSGCSCEWYEGIGCRVKILAEERFTEGSGDSFSCSSSYTLGECTDDGVQDVFWESNASVVSGFEGSVSNIPAECLVALGCSGGSNQRFCGEALVKLPFFSFFSLIVSLSLIFLFYFFRRS